MNADFFAGNRQSLLKKLNSGALVVITGYGEMQRMNDSAQSFEQEANFWYLTGIEYPDWWLILDGFHGTEWLVAPEQSDIQKIFEGGYDDADITKTTGIKTILDRDEALRRLRQLTKKHTMVYTTAQPRYLEHATFQHNVAQADLKKILDRIFQNVQICNRDLAALRTIKQPKEISAIQKAVNITEQAFDRMRETMATAQYEYELEATLTYEIRRRGANGHAYDPIVAGGVNACTLHYSRNDARLSKKNLVLFDVGARYTGYAADISRTYALSVPSKRQLAVHTATVEVQRQCISLMKPGLLFKEYDERCEQYMKKALGELGFATDNYREYFPHAMGHGLGIDVHDALAGYEEMQPGMVITVEPGIYIREEGIGVRIEDDILITEKGHKNLSAHLSTDIR